MHSAESAREVADRLRSWATDSHDNHQIGTMTIAMVRAGASAIEDLLTQVERRDDALALVRQALQMADAGFGPHEPAEIACHAAVFTPPLEWVADGEADNPRRRLIADVVVAGAHMHLSAWEVRITDGEQIEVVASDDELTAGLDDLTRLYDLVGGDDPFQTTTIDGRSYVLVAYPHS